MHVTSSSRDRFYDATTCEELDPLAALRGQPISGSRPAHRRPPGVHKFRSHLVSRPSRARDLQGRAKRNPDYESVGRGFKSLTLRLPPALPDPAAIKHAFDRTGHLRI